MYVESGNMKFGKWKTAGQNVTENTLLNRIQLPVSVLDVFWSKKVD